MHEKMSITEPTRSVIGPASLTPATKLFMGGANQAVSVRTKAAVERMRARNITTHVLEQSMAVHVQQMIFYIGVLCIYHSLLNCLDSTFI
jgi:hypothetical protein